MSNDALHGVLIAAARLFAPHFMSSQPTPPGPFLHSGTIDSYCPLVSARAMSRPTSGQFESPMRSGRLVPSHVVIGMEKVTGMMPHPSSARQMLRSAPARAVASALEVN